MGNRKQPFGYKIVLGEAVIHAEEARVVQQIFKQYLMGESLRTLDWLESLPFTVLFVSGNHENFDLLERFPVEEWHGGKVQFIRPHVIHLLRGQVFEIEGYTFFTMGGASSHDIENGILNPYAEDFEATWQDVLAGCQGLLKELTKK